MTTIDLNGPWQLESGDGKDRFQIAVPGSVFHELEKAGRFGEEGIFYRENNRLCLPEAEKIYRFSRTFTIGHDELAADELLLECDGLDTLATIRINGDEVARTKNMHRRYRFEISDFVCEGENRIEIEFANSLEYLRREHERRKLWHVSWEEPDYQVQGFNMIRKSHCSYGWDWGPIVPDVGIWRDIRIAAYSGARLDSVLIRQNHEGDGVELSFEPEWELISEGEYRIEGSVTAPDGREQSFEFDPESGGTLTIDHPELWWPNGLGEQPLYTLQFRLLREKEEIDRKEFRIGLRTVSVKREQDQWGESFTFVVNGVEVFARGADYIPEDVALTRVDREMREKLIRDSARANFNSLRVWGGGVYPGAEFFDLCDEYGLLVWQDMMFACATYDVRNPEFEAEICAEVEDNLQRIRHHASLGLVCGNNEMEWGYEVWGFNPSREQRTEYLKQYQFLFPAIAERVAPESFYWPASPSSGGDFDYPNDPDRGDCHFWEVWHELKPFNEYEKHYFRFMSEFGFESFPSIKTVKSYTAAEDRNPFSPVMEDHQRHIGGNGKILAYLSAYFRYPETLEQLVYLSQVSQAEALRHGIEHWRRHRGRCMGAVYWQLNDNWPVASWSSIDYYGRWKALHYAAARSFDNLLLSSAHVDGRTGLHLSNEGTSASRGRLEWSLSDLEGAVLEEGGLNCGIDAFSSSEVASIELGARAEGRTARTLLLFARYVDADGRERRMMRSYVPYKSLDLKEPGVEWQMEEQGAEVEITLRAARPALFVWLDFESVDRVFSDNLIHLAAGEERRIRCDRQGADLAALKGELKLTSLYDSYLK